MAKEKIQKVQIVNQPIATKSDLSVMKNRKPPMPHLGSVSEKTLPAIKNWKIGKEYEVTLKVKMTGIRQGYDWEYSLPMGDNSDKRPKLVTADFEVTEIKTEDDKGTKELKDKFADRYRS